MSIAKLQVEDRNDRDMLIDILYRHGYKVWTKIKACPSGTDDELKISLFLEIPSEDVKNAE